MTESNRSLDELPALIAERQKFEAWISALEGRRDATAAHVFERVHTDYLGRLREVDDRLAAHRSAILDEKTSLVSRRSLLEAEEQLRRDERAELELRAHVGELIGEDSESAFGSVDEVLAKMAGERDGLSKRIDELDGFLTLPARAEPAAEAEPHSEPLAQTSMELKAEEAPATSRTPTPAASAQSADTAAAANATQPASPTPVDINKLVQSEHVPAVHRPSGQMTGMDEAAEPVSEQGAGGPPSTTRGQRITPGGRFDELAFLSDVVGLKPAAPVPPPAAPPSNPPLREEPAKSPLDGMTSGRPAMATPPLASNVGNTPIVLRASGAISQSKTLKCTECGAMNYPTEWYCERCGAELAAL